MDAGHIEDIRSAMAERVERAKIGSSPEDLDELAAWVTVLVQDFTALTARVEQLEQQLGAG